MVTRLSRYYDTARTVCYPCQERANPLHVVAAPPPRINYENEALHREDRVTAVFRVAASLPQPFTAVTLAEAIGVHARAASNTITALVRRGLVVKAGLVRSTRPNNRGMMALWRVKP